MGWWIGSTAMKRRILPLDLVKGRSIELEVPAASEFVIEGYIDYAEQPVEAPSIAGPAGHYLPAEPLPVSTK